jgi:tetratricopeptide (TPR) repeat protein
MDSEAMGRYADSLFIEAENRKLQGDAAEAVRLFGDFLKLRPANATVYYELALLNGREKNAAATLEYARKAVTLDSTNHWFAIAYANALAMNKHFDSAAGVFHRLSLRFPSQEQYRYNEAVMLSSAGKYPRALELFDHLEKASGINEEFVYQKQRIFLEMGKPDSAALEIQKLIDINPGNSRFYGLLAQVYADNNQPDKAIGVYRSLLDKYPGNPQAMVALGLFYKQKGNDSAFRRYMAHAFGNPRFDIEEKLAFVYPYLKYVEIDSTKKDEALSLCRLIVEAHPDDPRAHTLYGDMYFQCKMPDSALNEYRETLALNDSSYAVWNQVMLLYATGGRNDSLLAASNRAAALFPAQPGAWYFRGMALFFAGKFEDCTRSLREALRHEVRDKDLKGRIYATLGEAYHNLGDYAASDSSFQTALQLNPTDDLTLNNYSYYLAERGQYLDQALRMIKTAVTLKPGSMTYEDTYGWVLFRMGKYKSAKAWMEKALSHPGAKNHPGYLEHYGDILYRNHEVDQAVTYWKMAKEKGGTSASLDRKIAKQKLSRREESPKHRRP